MHNDTHAFIVRIWHEAEDGQGNAIAVRGSIDHVGSKRRQYFRDLEGIARFIEEQTGLRLRRRRFLPQSVLGRFGRGSR